MATPKTNASIAGNTIGSTRWNQTSMASTGAGLQNKRQRPKKEITPLPILTFFHILFFLSISSLSSVISSISFLDSSLLSIKEPIYWLSPFGADALGAYSINTCWHKQKNNNIKSLKFQTIGLLRLGITFLAAKKQECRILHQSLLLGEFP